MKSVQEEFELLYWQEKSLTEDQKQHASDLFMQLWLCMDMPSEKALEFWGLSLLKQYHHKFWRKEVLGF